MRSLWLITLLVACPGGEPDETGSDPESPLASQEVSTASDANGLATVYVDVEPGQDAFMITASSESYLALEEIYDPVGNLVLTWADWYDEYSLTEAVFADYRDVYVNWPIRREDGPLEPGTYQVVFATVDGGGTYEGDRGLDATVQRRTDDDLTTGTVRVRVFYSEDVGSDPERVAGVEASFQRWSEVWAPFGLSLEWTTGEMLGDTGTLAAPGANTWSDVTSQTDDTQLTLIVGSAVDDADTFGIAGCIPCSTVPSGRGLVIVSWLAHAGADGILSDDETRLFGETLAHEAGHHMGLYHPVEDGWEYWDAIDDTVECATMDNCESSLGDNLMFPYPVCSWSECTPQVEMSTGQSSVKHRWAATL